MSKLSHVVAVSKSVKTQAETELTKAHQTSQRSGVFSGLNRTYQPLNEGELPKPPESTRVQVTADDMINELSKSLIRLFDVTATQDYGNTVARGDVVVDNVTPLLSAVPVSYLLFLEKQLVSLRTFIQKLPVLDPSEYWQFDAGTGLHRTEATQTASNKKVYRNHVKAEATEKHPAQVEIFTEDVPVGHWHTVKFSGALPATRVKELLERVTKLQESVKVAREQANATEVEDLRVGEVVLGWIFR